MVIALQSVLIIRTRSCRASAFSAKPQQWEPPQASIHTYAPEPTTHSQYTRRTAGLHNCAAFPRLCCQTPQGAVCLFLLVNFCGQRGLLFLPAEGLVMAPVCAPLEESLTSIHTPWLRLQNRTTSNDSVFGLKKDTVHPRGTVELCYSTCFLCVCVCLCMRY